MKYYIVQRVNYEYNDNIHCRPEGEGGTPEIVFQDKNKAQNRADKLNAEELSEINLMEYGYGIEEVVSDSDRFLDAFNSVFDETITQDDLDNHELTLPKMSVNQYKKIKDYLNVQFYEVVECDGE